MLRRSLTRAQFARGLACASAGALLGPALASCGSGVRVNEPSIAIVGAGIAGLTAALQLHDGGLPATVYEASNRIGGRMHSESRYWNDGQHTEWCGAMIDSHHTNMHALAH